MRCFLLVRDHDVTGVSGTGVVAEGVEFVDGHCAVRWIVGEHRSTVTWDSVDSVEAIHGHGGATRIAWIDDHLTVATTAAYLAKQQATVAVETGEMEYR